MATSSYPDLSQIRIGFVGVGNMAQAIIDGWMKGDVIKPGQLMASAPSDRNLKVVKEKGIQTTHDNCEVVRSCDVVILACKPYHIAQVSEEIRSEVTGSKLVLSLLAAVTIPKLEAGLPSGTRVLRAMPNVASAVQEGCTMLVRGSNVTEADVALTRDLFSPIGLVEEGTDALCNVGGAYGGAIAYMAIVLESMSDGAVKMGMQRHMATRMAAQIMMGTGKMQLETGLHPGQIKDSVCSPNGTTIRGVHAMEQGGVRGALMEAMEVSVKRAEEIS
ncbi:pyrroline-5-carboxylate reductase 3-like [Amphiura filiformis]|uniref:pyrroline-5-carboxylate reductase 3-like n=1 Tax=Amphiura filiformis TaxID=82378 RepID=UPI003B22319F